MKQHWQRLVMKIDALSLRERSVIFLMIAVILVTIVNTAVLDPQFAKQRQLSELIKTQQSQIEQIQNEMQKTVKVRGDPDIPNRARLLSLQQQFREMNTALLNMQKGLVSPDRITVLLEDILNRNGSLRLLTLKTLPVTRLNDPVPGAAAPAAMTSVVKTAPEKEAAASQPVGGSVYKHGVQIVVQGNYLEMMKYMADLEAMQWQLFWGSANLTVEEYPKATLTLTLFTLSLDKKWLYL
ncbi:MAG: MSHA biogenesis protein MshJ [Pseudomonadota bacterium]